MEVKIADNQYPRDHSMAWVRYEDNWGYVEVEGYHAGEGVEEWFGDWDYEFCIKIPLASLPGLWKLLRPEAEVPSLEPKELGRKFAELLIEVYNGRDMAARYLMELCQKHDIEHDYWTWR